MASKRLCLAEEGGGVKGACSSACRCPEDAVTFEPQLGERAREPGEGYITDENER